MNGTEEEEGGIIAQAPDDVNDEKSAAMLIERDGSKGNGVGENGCWQKRFALPVESLSVEPIRKCRSRSCLTNCRMNVVNGQSRCNVATPALAARLDRKEGRKV